MQKSHRLRWWLTGLILLVAAYVAWALYRPLPDLKPALKSNQITVSSPSSSLSWPNGQTAVGIVGSNIMQIHGQQKPLPTASTAKIITALMVLKHEPLNPGQQGPTINLTAKDQALYNAYNAAGGSVVPVQAGEQLSEYQALQALLLPSANNMADSLAIWAYGSLSNYSKAANDYIKQIGLDGTTIGSDASGYNPTTTSTAHDLVRLGELTMQNPVLAQIVGQSTANVPVAGNIKNVNFLLGQSNIIGIKTGNTDQAGGVYVGGARVTQNGKPVTIVTALMGAPTLFEAMKSSLQLIQSAETNFKTVTAVKANDVVDYYQQPWGGSIPAITSQTLGFTAWKGSQITANVKLAPIKANSHTNQTVSTLSVRDPASNYNKSVTIKLGGAPTKPTLLWRLEHPL